MIRDFGGFGVFAGVAVGRCRPAPGAKRQGADGRQIRPAWRPGGPPLKMNGKFSPVGDTPGHTGTHRMSDSA
jgi:hypothetical protein